MSITKILLLTTLGFVNTFGAVHPGFSYAVSAHGLNTLATALAPDLFDHYLTNVEIPDRQMKEGNLTNVHFTIDKPANLKDIRLSLNHATNGVHLSTSDLKAHITADFAVTHLFVTAKGTAKIDISDIVADLGVDFTTQQGIPSGLTAAIKTRKTNMKIKEENIRIQLEGEGVAKIGRHVKSLIKKNIVNQLSHEVKSYLPDLLDAGVNKMLDRRV
jgi:hypothetical protein